MNDHAPEADEAAASPKMKVRPEKPAGPQRAKPVAGKPDHVISPGSGKEVFVGGLPAGTLMRDPDFPEDESLFFVVPEVEGEEGRPPIARKAPGKPGFAFSPFNNKLIDVTGIPPGILVQDPTFPAEEKKLFRIPVATELIVERPPGQ